MTKPIYLQIHYTLTKQAFGRRIMEFNSSLEKEFKENPDEFRKKYGLESKSTFRALTIKSNVQGTAYAILDMFAKFLQNNENKKTTDPVFKITNKALRTKLNNTISKKTAWMHRERLTQAGILNESGYVFHGTNSGFEIGFNPNVLVACMHPTFTEMIVDNYINTVDNSLNNPEMLTTLSTIRPLFSDSVNGYIVTNCNYIIVPVQLQEHNINMDDTIRVENNLLPQIVLNTNQNSSDALTGTLQEQRSITKGDYLSAVALNFVRSETNRREQELRPRNFEIVKPTAAIDIFNFHVSSSLRLILNVLYKDKTLSDQDLQLATKDLEQYFSRKKSGKKISELSSDLWLAVMEAHKSKRRKGFIPAPLHKYLDVYFKGSLLSTTMDHVENTVKPYMKKNKEITDSVNEANQWYQLFVKSNNSSEVYRRATQNLNKKKNKSYLDFFNEAVSEHKNFDKQIIYKTISSQ